MIKEKIDRSKMRYLSSNELTQINDNVKETGICPYCGKSDKTEVYTDGLFCCWNCGWFLGFDVTGGYFEYAGIKQQRKEKKEEDKMKVKDKMKIARCVKVIKGIYYDGKRTEVSGKALFVLSEILDALPEDLYDGIPELEALYQKLKKGEVKL